ncbi:MAG: UDP-3-O-(3-hydroxymyristoyl)glucosamine N-acyltransferase [Thermodesulfovibrionales bacterium]|jgi:UDP-3-O-[3-hydroxymyristoyl] glucosamine N-acyltransferase
MRLQEIADLIGGEVIGDALVEIQGVSGISDALSGDITYLEGPKLIKALQASSASAVIVSEPLETDKPQVKVKNPKLAFAQLLSRFYPRPCLPEGISEKAWVSDKARIGEGVSIAPFAYISEGVTIGKGAVIYPGVFIGENSHIGDSCTLYANVTIREGVTIGDNVIIHAGAVIGADGFGYVFDSGRHHKIPQVGGVVIGDDVEIGANTTIDRATTGNTVIGQGTKIDNLVQIGHNVQVGRAVIIVSEAGIGGSSVIGDGVILAAQAGVADHARIEAGTIIGAQSGVMPGEVKKGVYIGSPILPHRDWLKAQAVFTKLPELNRRIKDLEEKIKQISAEKQ